MKEFADGNFKFDGNRGKFSERVENTQGKGKIAHNEQCYSVYKRLELQARKNQGLFGKGLTLGQSSLPSRQASLKLCHLVELTFYQTTNF